MARWEFEHSVFTKAKRENVWNYWTNMDNHTKMESSVEKIALNGPFASGTKGRTIAKDYTQEWELINVVRASQFTITGKTPDTQGFLSFSWKFEDRSTGTQLQQRIVAEGPQVEEYRHVFLEMETGAAASMDALAKELDRLHKTIWNNLIK